MDKLERKRAAARASMRKIREHDRERWLQQCRAASRRYRQRHPERVLEIQRRFRARRREQAWVADLARWRAIARAWLLTFERPSSDGPNTALDPKVFRSRP
jgi:hypothetical protein